MECNTKKAKNIKVYSYSGYGTLNKLPIKDHQFYSVEDALQHISTLRQKGRLWDKQIVLIDYSSNQSKIVKIIEVQTKVAVLCGSIKIYLGWVDSFGKVDEQYHIINDFKGVAGHKFDRVVRLAGYYTTPEIEEIEEYLKTHTINYQ